MCCGYWDWLYWIFCCCSFEFGWYVWLRVELCWFCGCLNCCYMISLLLCCDCLLWWFWWLDFRFIGCLWEWGWGCCWFCFCRWCFWWCRCSCLMLLLCGWLGCCWCIGCCFGRNMWGYLLWMFMEEICLGLGIGCFWMRICCCRLRLGCCLCLICLRFGWLWGRLIWVVLSLFCLWVRYWCLSLRELFVYRLGWDLVLELLFCWCFVDWRFCCIWCWRCFWLL